jgi:D-alanine-D-alanine ligase
MRPVILSSAQTPQAAPHELDDLMQVQTVEAALRELGYDPEPLSLTLDMEAARSLLRSLSPPFVFNLVESLDGKGSLIHLGPALLESLALPYTGCPTEALFTCSNKLLAKKMLKLAGLRTPEWISRNELSFKTPPGSTLILKSVWEHASAGLDESSLVRPEDTAALRECLEQKAKAVGAEVFAEKYIEGREFNVSVLEGPSGPEVLPVAEILFQNYEESRPKIVCYKAKWDPDSFQFRNTPRSFSFQEQDKLLPLLGEIALKCWRLFGLRGYARVDIRVDPEGRPWILEVNPNPCISPDAGFMAAAKQAGLDSREVVARILEASGIPRNPLTLTAKAKDPFLEIPGREIRLRREVLPEDLAAVRRIVLSTGLFRAQEVEVAVELVQETLSRGAASGYQFLFVERQGRTIGYACYGPIACTASSFDLYWIAVEKGFQGYGIGRILISKVEEQILQEGARRLYVETSSRPDYEPTLRFYLRQGYLRQASLENFYSEGDHKLILVKELASAGSLAQSLDLKAAPHSCWKT